MRVVNCTWELTNLNVTTAEVLIEKDDVFNSSVIKKLDEDFQYIVIKVPVCMPAFNLGLSNIGYSFIETQISISKKYNDFRFQDRLIKQVYPHTDLRIVKSQEELELLLSRVTPDMFTTDRISLDPFFDPERSSRRYTNWIRSEFNSRKSTVHMMCYSDSVIGFSLSRLERNGTLHGLLGGIFKEYQTNGLGMVTAASYFIDANKNNTCFNKFLTTISSNNTPMLQLYNYLGFKVDRMTYVFTKHNL